MRRAIWVGSTIVVAGPASPSLAARLAEALEARLVGVESKLFPDGESYVRLKGDVKGEDVVIVQSCYQPQDKHLLELLLLIDTAKDLGAGRVVAAVPYLAYSRQDKRFLEGEAVSGRLILKLMSAAGADGLVTVDVHSEGLLRQAAMPAVSVSAAPLLASYLASRGLKGAFVLSPDRKREAEARLVAEVLGGEHSYLEKTRDRVTGEVRTEVRRLPVGGRDVVVVDDIISTGGTIAKAASIVKAQGARRVVAACTHPILAGGALERMYSAGVEEVVGTDAVESEVSKVTVAPALAQGVRRLLEPSRASL
jgi:ribose-phosphate pyrophosphokinase